MKRAVGVILIFLSVQTWAQREVNENTGWGLKDRIYTGGGLALNGGNDGFGNRYFYFAVNPIVGYMVTPKFSVGTGATWQRFAYTQPIKLNIDQYGVSPFMRYNFNQLFAYGEYNLINTPIAFGTGERMNFDRLLLGLGYTQPFGKRSAINLMALYDVIYDNQERAFASPWVFRVFFTL
ncbi:MAG: hypothetical protein KF763_14325 [Cyclobacteriaceae bacterium]|nr:hypothetical protein [Cyclobacteriaceae bacterium]